MSTAEHIPLESSVPPDQQLRARHLGDGDFPVALNRFSWGAYFLPLIWGLTRRVWWILGLLALLWSVGPTLLRLLPGKTESPWWIAFCVVYALVTSTFFLWLGVNGNRLAWKAASRLDPAYRGATVGNIIDGEKRWIIFGALAEGWFSMVAIWGVLQGEVGSFQLIAVAFGLVSLGIALYLSRRVGSPLWHWLAGASNKGFDPTAVSYSGEEPRSAAGQS